MDTAAKRLAKAIIEKAIADLSHHDPEVRRRANVFLDDSDGLHRWSGVLNVAPMDLIAAVLMEMDAHT